MENLKHKIQNSDVYQATIEFIDEFFSHEGSGEERMTAAKYKYTKKMEQLKRDHVPISEINNYQKK